mmetsp:Transcript_14395/g.22995  ORF Transcript_14395/g.22995 Transcript_14395/m.22995 type:complete len:334 (-) Transcript_14395:405-1406(-)
MQNAVAFGQMMGPLLYFWFFLWSRTSNPTKQMFPLQAHTQTLPPSLPQSRPATDKRCNPSAALALRLRLSAVSLLGPTGSYWAPAATICAEYLSSYCSACSTKSVMTDRTKASSSSPPGASSLSCSRRSMRACSFACDLLAENAPSPPNPNSSNICSSCAKWAARQSLSSCSASTFRVWARAFRRATHCSCSASIDGTCTDRTPGRSCSGAPALSPQPPWAPVLQLPVLQLPPPTGPQVPVLQEAVVSGAPSSATLTALAWRTFSCLPLRRATAMRSPSRAKHRPTWPLYCGAWASPDSCTISPGHTGGKGCPASMAVMSASTCLKASWRTCK